MVEPDAHLDALANAVIGAAIEVHRTLGAGYLESVYEEALGVELSMRNIPYVRQHGVRVLYKGVEVGEGRIDLLVEGRLVVEIKTVDALIPVHRAQVISYLKALGQPLGLLMNFRAVLLRDGLERVVYTVPGLGGR